MGARRRDVCQATYEVILPSTNPYNDDCKAHPTEEVGVLAKEARQRGRKWLSEKSKNSDSLCPLKYLSKKVRESAA